ncbi:hypothetical protein I302_104400 [Kwoniella bestiolae CBS 10118]|uniref:Uncharacterized protein n=1 Tax=Kwoniella bestiolae CBS 10118 TaxID=1296100 RepID=A0A1B9GB68_9TREE|nr:hypothetical protein I302_03104 [Kwoniella bestiolae CBS 10118]OCF28252.1 hypothetical protein I302_03104 [Kwoniella bestiolae CBS 10118]
MAATKTMDHPLATSSHVKIPAPRLNVVRDPSGRVRQAVRDNNVSLLSRLQHKTDLRNTDKNRLTSLSWSAIEGSLEVFEWLLLDYGHDDQELSRDADNNTLLHLLASIPSLSTSPFNHHHSPSVSFPAKIDSRSYEQKSNISLRMTELYFTLFPFLLDWSNSGGKTSLHVAAQCGNWRFIDLVCSLGADLTLTDLQGNTPLHYASAWGHLDTIRVILENSGRSGSLVSIRNFEGFTALDFAYNAQVLGEIQSIQREIYQRRREERSRNDGLNENGGRVRSTSMGSSASNSNSNVNSGSYSSQPGRYIDQSQIHQQPLPPLPLPVQGLGERSSSLPMSRLDSSSSQHGGTQSNTRGEPPTRPSIPHSSSSQRSTPQGGGLSAPANPQAVLGRPTPPLPPATLNPPSTADPSGNGRPSTNRSPSMPTSGSTAAPGAGASLMKPQGSEVGLPIPLPREGVMMGSVMRRANSAQTGGAGAGSMDFSMSRKDSRI